MKPLLDGLRWVVWTPCYFALCILGPLVWATICLCGVVVIISAFALPIYLMFHLVCDLCH
jgi:hypothetical protein